MEQRILPVPQKHHITDQEMGNGRVKKKTGRKHKAKWLNKPMALAELILEIYDEDLRENALTCLSTHLNEKGTQEPEKYRIAGFYIYHGYGVMPILLQEVIMAYQKLLSGNFNIRASKRLSNVLTLFQASLFRALDQIRGDLPSAFLDNTLNGILEEFPNIKQLLHQLLQNIGKFQDSMFVREENLVMIGLWQP